MCRHFGTPVGQTVFKSGQTLVFMKSGEFWGSNHDHLDAGCFQIYDGAPLLTDSGVYDSYHTPHRKNYLIQTAAHNCLTVEPPEGARQSNPGGGQRMPGGGREPKTPETLFCDEYRAAYTLDHSESDRGCSMTVDLTPAYRHSCQSVVREMSFDAERRVFRLRDTVTPLAPGALVISHFHVQTEPIIDSEILTATVENGPGKAVIRVLSPADAVISAEGGPGREFVTVPGGENYPPSGLFHAEAGWGQIEVCARAKSGETIIEAEIRLL
ncbi:MAG: heparinase II/III family protein [Clostridia bacterium]|nr:heparinase II/III family protein [Clostridia bacterium]